jgi:hypothetical protein
LESASLNLVKKELNHVSQVELIEICLRLSLYKRENKELLSYLLFDAHHEEAYILKVKQTVDEQFALISGTNLYHVKKSLRKILKLVTKFTKFSGNKQTEVELLIHFIAQIKANHYHNTSNVLLSNLYQQQLIKVNKAIEKLHEDLQYDYKNELEKLN